MWPSGIARAWIRYSSPMNWRGEKVNPPHANSRGDVCVAQALPVTGEVVRVGESWLAIGGPIAFLTSQPTNSAILMMKIYNKQGKGGKSFIIDSIRLTMTTIPTTPVALTMCIMVSHQYNIVSSVPTVALLVPKSLSGRRLYSGTAQVTGPESNFSDLAAPWTRHGCVVSATTADVGLTVVKDLFGRFIISPGAIMGIHGHVSTISPAGSLGHVSVIWHERTLATE